MKAPEAIKHVCDCCLEEMDRFWIYRHRGFGCVTENGRQTYVAGWWAFCFDCHALFTEREIQVLVARVALFNPQLIQHDAETVYSALADAVYGEPDVWAEGEEWSNRRFPCPPDEVKL